MEINSTHCPFLLVEADVVESLEASTVDRPDSVIWHEEMLFPPHEDIVLRRKVRNGYRAFARLLRVWSEGGKLVPMTKVDLFGRTP